MSSWPSAAGWLPEACSLITGRVIPPASAPASPLRLPAIWQAVEFSHWMLQLLLASQAGTAEAAYREGLRQARLTRLMNGEAFARAFAVAYVGIDP